MNSESEQKQDDSRSLRIENLPIELYKILKLEGLVQSGGEAKHVIADGLVTVNGEVETRKRKKIVSGDRIEFAGVKIEIATVDEDA
jgi:ribosome-associated protein